MKKQLLVCGISVLLVTGTAYNLSAQKEKKNDKKEHPAKEEKQEKGNRGNDQDSKGNKNGNGKENGNNNGNDNNAVKKNSGNHENNGNGNKGKNNHGDDFAGNSKNLKGANKNHNNYYNWTPETFKDRKKLKNQDRVSICHKFNSNNEPAVNIRVSANAAKAHMNHGDVMGDCPVASNTNFSDIFLRKRTDYFNSLESSREELMYSRSIYDYAMLRLTNSKTQLATMQANQLSQAEIARKQATVVELEQNVSLLETLIGVAANLLVSKLQ